VLRYFNAEEYTCIFTSNASGALKIVGESYPFDTNAVFMLTADNHNSVNGIREFCAKKGGHTHYVPVQYEDLMIPGAILEEAFNSYSDRKNKLFAFPAQSNVSGVKHDLKWIDLAHQKGFDVLLDAAAFVPSSKLDLSLFKPDFVSVSFYKIFGYPTGIGCLLVHNSAIEKLVKPWFAGGTVTLVSVASQSRFLASGHERFEDGTINYTELPAVKLGLEFMESVGIERINRHVATSIAYLANQLSAMQHANGTPLVKIFGPSGFSMRGGNIIFNILNPAGIPFPFQQVESEANARKISIRTGCFCNPGIDEINNCLGNNELASYFTSRDQGNYYDMIAYLGKMRGAIRTSVGMATVRSDLDAFLRFVETYKDRR
jgi:molybdenum cofactor sulfurtransferase